MSATGSFLPSAEVQRLAALDLTGDREAAGALFARLSSATEQDAKLSASLGWTLTEAGQFEQAETFLAHALAADPSDFQVLYDLGVVACYARHYDRARDVLETAVRQQADNEGARINVVGDPYANAPTGTPSLPHGRIWFNPAAFAEPAIGTIGNAGVNIMYGPGYFNNDMTLNRKIPLGPSEKRQLQLKLEAFNVFNHTQFTGVNSTYTFNAAGVNTNANIGALTGERGPRIVSLELRVMF